MYKKGPILRELLARLWGRRRLVGGNYREYRSRRAGRVYWHVLVASLRDGYPVLCIIEEGEVCISEFRFQRRADLAQLQQLPTLSYSMRRCIRQALGEYLKGSG
jgi:hypothetical protein